MANETALTSTINFVPVQGVFTPDAELVTLIGPAGTPFYATTNPDQSGLNITNSTINSTTIGAVTPSTGVFTNISATTGQVSTAPAGATDIANKQYVDYYAAGLSWKIPATAATLTNITLSGLQTIDTVSLVAGDTVLVKNQTNAAQNGIYVVSAGAWTYAIGGDVWSEYVGAIIFIVEGDQGGSAWYSTAQPGGTLGVTALTWANFSVASTYSAGTGLTLTGQVFSITNTGVTAATKGSASKTVTAAVNAQGQLTSLTDQDIAIAATQITSGTIDTARISGSYTGITGVGTLGNLTVTNTISGSISGNAATATTATSATTATNLAGGVSGSVPYQTASGATSLLAVGTNGQVLTLASGIPSWATPTTGTVTSVSGTGTVNGLTLTGTVTSTGNLTLGGTLSNVANSALTNSSITFGATAAALGTTVSGFNAVTIGATTPSTGAFTNLSTNSSTSTTPVLGYNATNCNLALGGTIANTYLQAVMQNKSGTAGASTNFAVSNDLGTDSTYYGEFGMNSSVFSASTPADFFSINNGTYFSSHDGDVTIGSGNGYKTYLAWGTTGQSAHVINATGAIGLNTNLGTTPAGSGTTNFGTSGQVLTSAGSAATPTWTTPTSGITITDDTSTNASRYLTFTSATSGSITGANTSSTKLSVNPSTGLLSGIALTLAGTTSAAAFKTPNIKEVATVSATAATGTIAYDITTQSVLYYTSNASANWTVNFRGSSGTSLDTVMATGESMSATFMVTQGATPYYNSAVQVDGNAITPKWQGGTAPSSGNASGIDIYSYVIIKTGSATFTVLASQTQFK